MRYKKTREAVFIQRVNRFLALCRVDGQAQRVHVKNTGRLRELFIPGARCMLSDAMNTDRKTKYDLIGIWRNDVLVNVDSQAPNAAAKEWVEAGGLGDGIIRVHPETVWGDSRFDLYAERDTGCEEPERLLIEVKGVTLNKNGIARFPDAPTERGVKHLRGLTEAVKQRFRCAILFVIQMPDCVCFEPNDDMHSEFGDALRAAQQAGVEIHAVLCENTPDTMTMTYEIPVRLTKE